MNGSFCVVFTRSAILKANHFLRRTMIQRRIIVERNERTGIPEPGLHKPVQGGFGKWPDRHEFREAEWQFSVKE